ncbi:hypothetical protein ISCGN_001025 [Ixodes scapularis]
MGPDSSPSECCGGRAGGSPVGSRLFPGRDVHGDAVAPGCGPGVRFWTRRLQHADDTDDEKRRRASLAGRRYLTPMGTCAAAATPGLSDVARRRTGVFAGKEVAASTFGSETISTESCGRVASSQNSNSLQRGCKPLYVEGQWTGRENLEGSALTTGS